MAVRKKKKLKAEDNNKRLSISGAESSVEREETLDLKNKTAPHFDTNERTQESNFDVETPQASIPDSFQTENAEKKN